MTAITTDPRSRHVVAAETLRVGAGRLRRFVGREHGAGISYFFVDNEPGEGPGLHRHPYPETWVVLDGQVRITVDGETIDAGPGDTATAPAGAWHGFMNTGTGRLRILCIHASDRIIQEWKDAPGILDIPSAD
ncbi:quercetin dioxygenase-like cupin family protein [Microbacterium terrae]|uniref:Cupin domain protein n=1 Tax=Microbacterium terrae TaxID=69369 RepID=A0A0M2H4C7_9MICO|nr:cupin domain-containing protein [Microbacterium terrae]KJL38711.1 Cupin domain protein [Microbacterium terrae]MBP1076130.1 quercetin dioxygenase-like cupin family protein [Microbacterium terrae]GLJ96950.1 cupin [Microbacterium terrae]